ncbi:MAG: excisionase family DNA-binding protein [bacterium]
MRNYKNIGEKIEEVKRFIDLNRKNIKFFTVNEMSDIIKLPKRTIYKAITENRLSGVRLQNSGKKILVPKDNFLKFLDDIKKNVVKKYVTSCLTIDIAKFLEIKEKAKKHNLKLLQSDIAAGGLQASLYEFKKIIEKYD